MINFILHSYSIKVAILYNKANATTAGIDIKGNTGSLLTEHIHFDVQFWRLSQ